MLFLLQDWRAKNILVTIRGYSGDAIGLNPIKKFAFDHIFEPLTLKLSRNFYTVGQRIQGKDIIQTGILVTVLSDRTKGDSQRLNQG